MTDEHVDKIVEPAVKLALVLGAQAGAARAVRRIARTFGHELSFKEAFLFVGAVSTLVTFVKPGHTLERVEKSAKEIVDPIREALR